MLNLFIENIKSNIPFTYTKFGDGEIICICKRYLIDAPAQNCDSQTYSDVLSNLLIQSADYFSGKENVFIGEWDFDSHYTEMFNEFIKSRNLNFNYVPYDLLLHTHNKDIAKLKKLYLTLSSSPLKKIYICSEKNKEAEHFLNCEILIVPDKEAFNEYEHIRSRLLEKEYDIYLYSCGLMSKVLIKDVMPKNKIQLDIGSGLDNLFNGITRANQIPKDELIRYYRENT